MNKKTSGAIAVAGLGALIGVFALGYQQGTQRPQQDQDIGFRVQSTESQPVSWSHYSRFNLSPYYNGAHIFFLGATEQGIGKVFAEYDGKKIELKPHIYNEINEPDSIGQAFSSRSYFNVPKELLKVPEFTLSVIDRYGDQLRPVTVSWDNLMIERRPMHLHQPISPELVELSTAEICLMPVR